MRSEVTERKGRQVQTSRTGAGWEGRSVLGTDAPGLEYHLPPVQMIQYHIATQNSGRTPSGTYTCKIMLSKYQYLHSNSLYLWTCYF